MGWGILILVILVLVLNSRGVRQQFHNQTSIVLKIVLPIALSLFLVSLATASETRPPMQEYAFNELTSKDIYLIEKQRDRTREQAKWTGVEDEGWGIYNTNRVWIHVDDVIGYVSFPIKAISHNSYRYTTEEVINFYINKAVHAYTIKNAEHRILEISLEINEAYGFYLFTGTKPTEEELGDISLLLDEQRNLTELLRNK